jgi:hypothetical protein
MKFFGRISEAQSENAGPYGADDAPGKKKADERSLQS